MLQTSLLLMKGLSRTETNFLTHSVFFVSRGNLFIISNVSFVIVCMYVCTYACMCVCQRTNERTCIHLTLKITSSS